MRRWQWHEKNESLVRVPETPSTRTELCPGSETVRHAADDDKNRVDTAALGRDAPPARRRRRNGNPRLSGGQGEGRAPHNA